MLVVALVFFRETEAWWMWGSKGNSNQCPQRGKVQTSINVQDFFKLLAFLKQLARETPLFAG